MEILYFWVNIICCIASRLVDYLHQSPKKLELWKTFLYGKSSIHVWSIFHGEMVSRGYAKRNIPYSKKLNKKMVSSYLARRWYRNKGKLLCLEGGYSGRRTLGNKFGKIDFRPRLWFEPTTLKFVLPMLYLLLLSWATSSDCEKVGVK